MQLKIVKSGNRYSACTHDFDACVGHGKSELEAILNFKTNLIVFENLFRKEVAETMVIIDEELKEGLDERD